MVRKNSVAEIPSRYLVELPEAQNNIIPIGWRPVGGWYVINEFGSVAVTNSGIITPATMPTYLDLAKAERFAYEMKEASTWVLADIALYALDIDGYEAILDDYDEGYIKNLRSVAKAWPHNMRWPEIPYSWHFTINPIMVGARRQRERGNIEEADWLASVAYTWFADAVRLGWKRNDLVYEYRNFTLPPSMRFEMSQPKESAPLQLILNPPSYSFSLAETRQAVSDLVDWAKRNDCPVYLLNRVLVMLGIPKLADNEDEKLIDNFGEVYDDEDETHDADTAGH